VEVRGIHDNTENHGIQDTRDFMNFYHP